jgi:DNA invertase Pin-like site-specific DNA recombinase
MENQNLKYFIYCRKSKGKQEEKSPSIEGQYNELATFAKKEKLEIIDVFKETHGAFETGRPYFQEMIERIKNGEANGILTWEVSRLSRNLQDTATLDKLLHDKQLLKIRSTTTDYIDKDGEDFLLNMEFVISRQYSKEISRRTKRGLRFKLNQQEWPGWSPLGYVNVNTQTQTLSGQMTPYKKQVQKLLYAQWMKKDYTPRKIELDPIKALLVKKVFEEYSSGNYSLGFMLNRIEQIGLTGKSGKPVSKSCLVHFLTNPFYYGQMRFNGEIYEGKHEALISKSLFDRVQEVLKERNKPIKIRWQFSFTGLIKCGYCGCGITAEMKKNKYTYYHCSHMRDKKRHQVCPQPVMREEDLRKLLEKEVKKVTINDMIKELLTEAIRQSHKKEKELHRTGIKEWQIMYNTAESKLNRLFELFYNSLITQEEFGERKEEILAEKEKAKEHLETHGQAQKSWLNYSEKLIITTNHAYKVFKEGKPEEVKMLLQAIGKSYVLKDDILTFQFKEPFNFVARLNVSKSYNKTDWLRW